MSITKEDLLRIKEEIEVLKVKLSSFEEYVTAHFWDLDKKLDRKIFFKDHHSDHGGFYDFPLGEESEVSNLITKRYFEKVSKNEH